MNLIILYSQANFSEDVGAAYFSLGQISFSLRCHNQEIKIQKMKQLWQNVTYPAVIQSNMISSSVAVISSWTWEGLPAPKLQCCHGNIFIFPTGL